jgi:hypothetical protein
MIGNASRTGGIGKGRTEGRIGKPGKHMTGSSLHPDLSKGRTFYPSTTTTTQSSSSSTSSSSTTSSTA